MTNPQPAIASLLYPNGYGPTGGQVAPSEADLGLGSIVRALDYDGRHSRFAASILGELQADPAVIAYRQAALDELLRLPDLAASCAALLPQLDELANAGRASHWSDPIPLVQLAGRLAELDTYLTCVEGLAAALDSAGPSICSEAFRALQSSLATIRADPEYRRLAQELPQLRDQLGQAGSVTLGINLDGQLRPESAAVLSINPGRFAGKGTLLGKLFGGQAPDTARGITALYKAEEGRQHSPEHDLFRDLDRLLDRVAAPIAASLASYARINGAPLAALGPELSFLLGATRLAQQIRAAGLALCRPEIAPVSERICMVEGAYSLDLGLRLRLVSPDRSLAQSVVANEIGFSSDTHIFILTGPNSGGKTTYTRAVGQAQVLFQAGLLVPGQRARISPADAIFSHFAAPERADIGGGRLDEELARLAQIFHHATPASLVLLNEPLASTDQGAARALLYHLVEGLQLLGARAILVTHLHQLVGDLLDTSPPAAGIASLVAGMANADTPAPSFAIAPGRPEAAGYAAELARRHGLSGEQIAALLRMRGLSK